MRCDHIKRKDKDMYGYLCIGNYVRLYMAMLVFMAKNVCMAMHCYALLCMAMRCYAWLCMAIYDLISLSSSPLLSSFFLCWGFV